MDKDSSNNRSVFRILFRVIQGALIGLGAVLPGISGGVLCVVFGIYKPIMELLSHPLRNFKNHVPKLLPVILGLGIGFLGIANLLSFFLEKFREAGEQGRSKGSAVSLFVAMAVVFALLIGLQFSDIEIVPNFAWYLFCGFCLALSVIAPGMSFSTLLMPLGLYTPFVDGIGHLDLSVLIPGGIGALITVILLAKAVNALFERFYSLAFHAIIGIVIAATVMIIPYQSFAVSVGQCVVNLVCLAVGIVAALLLDRFNQSVVKTKE